MTTPAQPSEQTQSKQPSARTRSPAYPSISLKSALEKAKTVWEREKRNPTPLTALAEGWGLNLKSSATQLALASLVKFGLLENVEGAKERLLKLSITALKIILNESQDSPEVVGLLKQCALTPKIHAELWRKYNGDLPSDASLKQYLIVEKNFNSTAVDGFIRQFKDTIEFSKLSPSDKITTMETSEEDLELPGSEKPLFQQKAGIDSIKHASAPGTSLGNFGNQNIAVLREFSFPLPTGVATLKLPFPLTEEDFENLLKTLHAFKNGLVKKADPASIECTEGWQEKAKALIDLGVEFKLTDFDYSFDVVAAKEFAVTNSLELRLDLNNGIAIFRKRAEKK